MPMAEELACVHEMLEERAVYADDEQVVALVAAARQRFGDSVEAIVLYGSFTRGQRDTLLDFYVLLRDLNSLPAWQRALVSVLPPNVYQISTDQARAKVAVMKFDALERAVLTDIAPYFWARFAQPCALVYSASPPVVDRFAKLVSRAAERLVAAASIGDAVPDVSAEFWKHTFSLTYSAELRPEQASRYAGLYLAKPEYFDALHVAFANRQNPPQNSWRARRLAGKVLSFLRIVKSALTFDDPVDYVLWKVERHSGIKMTATPRQHRYPLIFGWGLVWRLYRQGAFK